MSKQKTTLSRRNFMKASAAASAVIAAPTIVPSTVFAQDNDSTEPPSERINLGFIGTGSRGMAHVNGLTGRPNVQAVAACDVDEKHLARAKDTIIQKNKRLGRGEDCQTTKFYEEIIARKDIDAVCITTPDHWHTKIAVEALRSGKDVYCEKPLTLTIDEGKILSRVTKETGRVFQVGTQQRSGRQFQEAVALVRGGHIGKIKKVTCAIGGGDKGGPFKVEQPPAELDWERWQGQVELTPYIAKKCHYQFRWWYEYSGGKMTDWGAHHVDIAQWGIGMEKSGPLEIEGTSKHQEIYNGYTTAIEFLISCKFEGGTEMVLRHDTENGITFEGERGTIFVNRGKRTGAYSGRPINKDDNQELLKAENPLKPEDLVKLYKDQDPTDHYQNFLNCVKSRKEPVSDVWSHHRILSTCHLANIAIRLDRKLKWSPAKEEMIDDKEANAWQKRAQRSGYEIKEASTTA